MLGGLNGPEFNEMVGTDEVETCFSGLVRLKHAWGFGWARLG